MRSLMSVSTVLCRVAGLVLGSAVLAACGGGAAAVQDAPSTTPAAPTTTAAAPTTTTTSPVYDDHRRPHHDGRPQSQGHRRLRRRPRPRSTAAPLSPGNCDVSTIAAPGSPAFANLTAFFAKLDRNGLRGRPSKDDYRRQSRIVQIDAGRQHGNARRHAWSTAGAIYDPRRDGRPERRRRCRRRVSRRRGRRGPCSRTPMWLASGRRHT